MSHEDTTASSQKLGASFLTPLLIKEEILSQMTQTDPEVLLVGIGSHVHILAGRDPGKVLAVWAFL